MITLPILLLILGVFGFWILTESKVNLLVKTLSIGGFSTFVVIFWMTITSFFGWAAEPASIMDKRITIHSIVIDEGTKSKPGGIYIIANGGSAAHTNLILKAFGHPIKADKLRFHKLEYSKELHKALVESGMMERLARGQKAHGVLSKKGNPFGKKGEKGNKEGKGEGDMSHFSELRFYNLQPSEAVRK